VHALERESQTAQDLRVATRGCAELHCEQRKNSTRAFRRSQLAPSRMFQAAWAANGLDSERLSSYKQLSPTLFRPPHRIRLPGLRDPAYRALGLFLHTSMPLASIPDSDHDMTA
jgi:hypothetical protein